MKHPDIPVCYGHGDPFADTSSLGALSPPACDVDTMLDGGWQCTLGNSLIKEDAPYYLPPPGGLFAEEDALPEVHGHYDPLHGTFSPLDGRPALSLEDISDFVPLSALTQLPLTPSVATQNDECEGRSPAFVMVSAAQPEVWGLLDDTRKLFFPEGGGVVPMRDLMSGHYGFIPVDAATGERILAV